MVASDTDETQRVTTEATTAPPLLRNTDFQSLWTSRFLAAVGKETAEIAYPLLILATTRSALYAGAVGSVQIAFTTLMSIVGGSLGDLRPPQIELQATDLAGDNVPLLEASASDQRQFRRARFWR